MAFSTYSRLDSLGRTIINADNEAVLEFPVAGLAFTPAGGIARSFINKTGAPTVRGTLVTLGSAYNSVVATTAGVPNCVGAIWCIGKADGEPCYVVVAGVADVLFVDGQAPTVGYWCGSSDTVNGRAITQQSPPGPSLPDEIESHNAEIGHCLQAVEAGTNVIAKVLLHFN